MGPNVSRLCVDPNDGLKAFWSGQRGPVAKVKKVVVLKPLWQVWEVDDLRKKVSSSKKLKLTQFLLYYQK